MAAGAASTAFVVRGTMMRHYPVTTVTATDLPTHGHHHSNCRDSRNQLGVQYYYDFNRYRQGHYDNTSMTTIMVDGTRESMKRSHYYRHNNSHNSDNRQHKQAAPETSFSTGYALTSTL